jgi:hypothetical protein
MRARRSTPVLALLFGAAACFDSTDGPAPSDMGLVGGLAPSSTSASSGASTSASTGSSASTSGAGGGGGDGGGATSLPLCACISDLNSKDECENCKLGVQLAECAFAFNACEEDLECSLAVSLCLPNCPPFDEACFETCLAIPALSRARADTLHSCYCTACSRLCGVSGGQGGASSCN